MMKNIPKITILALVFYVFYIYITNAFAELQTPNQEPNKPAYLKPTSPDELKKEDRIFGLVQIYSTAKQHFAYFEQVPQLDWDRAFKEFLPLVEKKQNLLEYYRTLQRFTALLEDGHTQVYLPKALRANMTNLPVQLNYIEDQWVVIERLPTEEVLKEDIPPGSVALSIEGTSTTDYIEKNMFPYIAHGTIQGKRDRANFMGFFHINELVNMKFRYPDGSIHSRVIRANNQSIKWTPELREKYFSTWRKKPEFFTKDYNGDILYVRYGKCNSKSEAKFSSLIANMGVSQPKAMILDLRRNGGGNTPHKTISHLISKKIPDRASKTRCSISCIDASFQMSSKMGVTEEQFLERLNEAKEKGELPKGYIPGWLVSEQGYIEPAEKHYKGQIIILIDVTTGSAAEDMAAKLKAASNVKIIGEPTNGSTGTPMFYDLPGGGRLRVCTINTPLSGVGVQPDISVNRTLKGIADGRDEILEAAIEYLRSLDKTVK